jgi:hypothetical protein
MKLIRTTIVSRVYHGQDLVGLMKTLVALGLSLQSLLLLPALAQGRAAVHQ